MIPHDVKSLKAAAIVSASRGALSMTVNPNQVISMCEFFENVIEVSGNITYIRELEDRVLAAESQVASLRRQIELQTMGVEI